MLDKNNFKDLMIYTLVIGLFILAAIIIKPVIFSIIYGILLAYIFYPLYKSLLRKTKSEHFSAFIVCGSLIIIILAFFSLIITNLLKQIVNIYLDFQKINITNLIRESFPDFIASSEFSQTLAGSINTSISNFITSLLNSFTDFILNLPIILLKLFVVIFVFYFALKDGDKALSYIRSLSPLKKETQERFFKQMTDITYSVLVGQIVVGVFQGLAAGISYFIFGVPNALLLTLVTVIVGVIPLIGPWLVWVPVDIYLFATGRSGAAIGLLIYGLLVITWIDTVVRPLIVSRKTKINSAIVIIGMIGGIFIFGLLGLIIGPLVLAYVLLMLELYRKKTIKESIIFTKEKPKERNIIGFPTEKKS